MNWFALLVLSVLIYLGFVWLGDGLSFFKSFKTANAVFLSPQFYLLVLLTSIVSWIFDMHSLILKKEIFTPMSIFFNSIIRRHREKDTGLFKRVIQKYKKRDPAPPQTTARSSAPMMTST